MNFKSDNRTIIKRIFVCAPGAFYGLSAMKYSDVVVKYFLTEPINNCGYRTNMSFTCNCFPFIVYIEV